MMLKSESSFPRWGVPLAAMLLILATLAFLPQTTVAEEPVRATTPSKAPSLTPRDRADLARLESWLNTRKTIQADFVQVTDLGDIRTGTLAISRPSKMRITYYRAPIEKSPSEGKKTESGSEDGVGDFIVADGTFVTLWDSELQTITSVPQKGHLASFILRDPLRLSGGDVQVTGVTRQGGMTEVSLVARDDPESGTLTLVFEDKPLSLTQWYVKDPTGRITRVTLQNVREDVTFPEDLFFFREPDRTRKPSNPLSRRAEVSKEAL